MGCFCCDSFVKIKDVIIVYKWFVFWWILLVVVWLGLVLIDLLFN